MTNWYDMIFQIIAQALATWRNKQEARLAAEGYQFFTQEGEDFAWHFCPSRR